MAVALLLMDAPPNSLFSDLITDLNYQSLIQGGGGSASVLASASRVVGHRVTQSQQTLCSHSPNMSVPYTKFLPKLSSTLDHGTLNHWSRPNGHRRCARDCHSRHSKLCSRAQHTSVSALYPSQLLKAMGWVIRCRSI